MKNKINELLDESEWPFHMRGDVRIHNKNILEGKDLCERCEGTGNEFFSMYHKCPDCNGTGIRNNENK